MDKWPKTVESLSDGLMSLRCNFHCSPVHTGIAIVRENVKNELAIE